MNTKIQSLLPYLGDMILESTKIQDNCIFLFSDQLEEKQGLATALQLLIDQTTCLFEKDELSRDKHTNSQLKLVIYDFNRLNNNTWSEHKNRIGSYEYLAVINTPSDDHALELIERDVHGVFYENDTMESIVKGVRCILAGELWYKRAILSRVTKSHFNSHKISKYHNLSQVTTKFSKREIDVIRQLALGKKNKEIAKNLYISEHTIKSHIRNIFKKTNAKNRMEIVVWVLEYFPEELLIHYCDKD